ncbi:bis(5'-nucleosyl)-tetraphosphatase (symmetrical) YqeK [Virgibacillus ainsalahensis]
MKIDEAINYVKPLLTKERFEHSLRVAETAVKLAKLYDESEEKAELAGVCHDYCKYRPLEKMKKQILESSLPKDLLQFHHELWHGPVGALLLEKELGINDKSIQNSVHYHTTGRANMSKLELIIFLADYIEPGRSFPGIDEVREMAEQDLIQACWMTSKNTIQYLMKKNVPVYPDTFHAYNDLTKKLNGGH